MTIKCGCSSNFCGKGVPSRSINTALTLVIFFVDLPSKSVSLTQKNIPAPCLFNLVKVLKCFCNDPCNCLISFLFLTLSSKVWKVILSPKYSIKL